MITYLKFQIKKILMITHLKFQIKKILMILLDSFLRVELSPNRVGMMFNKVTETHNKKVK